MNATARSFVMSGTFAAVVAGAVVAFAPAPRAAGAEDGPTSMQHMVDHTMAGHSHMAMSPADGRKPVHFPPEMRTQMLRNMRDHVETLNGVLGALASQDFDGASKIAVERLGLDSPSAAACKPKPANAAPSSQGSMDEMMALYMPEPMRAIGLAMHTSASEFSVVASRGATTHDTRAAVEALSRVTQNCVACHAAYRLQ